MKKDFFILKTCGVAVDCSGKAVETAISKSILIVFWVYQIIAMPSAGYSGKSLITKLGIKPEMKILLINEPSNYVDLLETDISDQLCNGKEIPHLIHVFVKNNKEFESRMKKLRTLCSVNPKIIIWVSWYKKSSKIQTDVTEDVIRNYALRNDLVDVKVCAVSDVWSGLKLVVPLTKRK